MTMPHLNSPGWASRKLVDKWRLWYNAGMNVRKEPDTEWIQYRDPKPYARLRLFCFPYAGGSASLYRSYTQRLPREIEVCPVQLPGRESRMRELAYTRMDSLIHALVEALAPYLSLPYAFFGHSMGALISFELARALRQKKYREPVHLFVSGHRAPQLPARGVESHRLSDAQFLERLHDLKGTPQKIIAHPELMQLFLPLLRADFELCETYRWRQETPLACPLSAYGGTLDEEVPQESILAWREHTSRSFQMRFFPGGHFFIQKEQPAVLLALAQELSVDLQVL